MPLPSRLLTLLLCGLASIGCKTYRQPPYPAMWEIEQFVLGQAQAAYRAADGAIAIRYHIQRELQPTYSGYHWLVIEPETAAQVLAPKTSFKHPQHSVYQRRFSRVRSEASNPKFNQPVNARMVPPILEPGLPNDRLPEEIVQPVQSLEMVWIEDPYSGPPALSLRHPGQPGIETRSIDLWPTIKRYQTEQGAANEQRYRSVSRPFNVVSDIATAPFHIAFALYLDWVWSKSRL